MKLMVTVGILLVIIFLFWVGLRIRPAPFPAFAHQQPNVETVPLPSGLPAPVERFYRVTYGEQVPVINTAVVSGRGSMRLFGLSVPIRFRFAHEAGHNYRHDIDLTFYGLRIMQGFETFIDGKGWARTPGGVDEGAGFDQGSNVSLWAEALNWFPAVLVTDPRVRWQPVDEATALLTVPFGSGQEVLVVRFDPATGTLQHAEAMKYNSASKEKKLWINSVWFHEGSPWIRLEVEDLLLNAEVHDYIRAERP